MTMPPERDVRRVDEDLNKEGIVLSILWGIQRHGICG
jgi:hypothetical protein